MRVVEGEWSDACARGDEGGDEVGTKGDEEGYWTMMGARNFRGCDWFDELNAIDALRRVPGAGEAVGAEVETVGCGVGLA